MMFICKYKVNGVTKEWNLCIDNRVFRLCNLCVHSEFQSIAPLKTSEVSSDQAYTQYQAVPAGSGQVAHGFQTAHYISTHATATTLLNLTVQYAGLCRIRAPICAQVADTRVVNVMNDQTANRTANVRVLIAPFQL